MSLENPAASTEYVSTPSVPTPVAVTSFEERWTAWQARGAAHDRAVRRKITIAVPSLLAVAAVFYIVFVR